MTVIWVALAAVVASLVGPLLLSLMTAKQRRVEKLEDWERQDAIAARVEEAARLLLERQNAAVLQAAETAVTTRKQLDQIHVLVNSNLTEAQSRELRATEAMLVTMREVVDLKRQGGVEPSPEALAAIESTQKRVNLLTKDLEHKVQQTRVADS